MESDVDHESEFPVMCTQRAASYWYYVDNAQNELLVMFWEGESRLLDSLQCYKI